MVSIVVNYASPFAGVVVVIVFIVCFFKLAALIISIRGTPGEDRAKIIRALGKWDWRWWR